MELTNAIFIKTSVSTEVYNVITNNAHENYGWTLIFFYFDAHAPHIDSDNGGLHTDIVNRAFKHGGNIEDFHNQIIRLHQ